MEAFCFCAFTTVTCICCSPWEISKFTWMFTVWALNRLDIHFLFPGPYFLPLLLRFFCCCCSFVLKMANENVFLSLFSLWPFVLPMYIYLHYTIHKIVYEELAFNYVLIAYFRCCRPIVLHRRAAHFSQTDWLAVVQKTKISSSSCCCCCCGLMYCIRANNKPISIETIDFKFFMDWKLSFITGWSDDVCW